MKKLFLLLGIAIMLNMAFALAHAGEDFNETKQLIDAKVSCNQLSNEQLEEIGDYYMEVMHPGSAHEQMHQMMGGEDSATVKSMHMNMARMMYCNEGSGMSNMMNMMGGGNMAGMMDIMGSGGMMSGGMMGNYGYGLGWGAYSILNTALIIGITILVYLGIIRLWKDLFQKRKK